jgi:CBS-domain-containing membrane protein
MTADDRTAHLGIRRCIVVGHIGQRVALSVFCPQRLQSTRVDVCRRCPSAVRIDEASVTCAPAVDPLRGQSVVGAAMGEASVTIEAATPIVELAPLVESGGWMTVVVLDSDHRALGLIDREQLTGVASGTAAGTLARHIAPVLESFPVMTAVRRMVHQRARALPVVDGARSAVGILTDIDALRWVAARAKKSCAGW